MALYATPADLALYAQDTLYSYEIPDGPEAERLLERAERDVDRACGPWPYLSTGLKFDPVALDVVARDALTRATCAAAEWRIRQREETLIGADDGIEQAGSVTFRRRALPRISPKMIEELAGSGLILRSGTVVTELDGSA